MHRLLVLAALLAALPAGAVDIDWVYVGDEGNPPDAADHCLKLAADCGSVPLAYLVSRHEITNSQYAEFLNAVAATDTYGLYSPLMDSEALGGITRSGSPGSYAYAPKSGHEGRPVAFVAWYDALRFANWLHNGQPAGAQDATTTEDGAYAFTGPTTVSARKAGAGTFLPTENEWYKAAYYDPALPGYYDYPAGTDAPITCAAPGATANTANCESAVLSLTDVGSYTGSPSPYGTFDQAGNVYEWNETGLDIVPSDSVGIRGGDLFGFAANAAASDRGGNQPPTAELGYLGFRVAAVPEPGHALLALTGSLVLAAARRRQR